MISAPTIFEQTLAAAQQLAPRDQARLIARLADALANTPTVWLPPHPDAGNLPIPVITEGQWDADLPTSRAELYADDERC